MKSVHLEKVALHTLVQVATIKEKQPMPSPFSTFEIHFDDNRTIFIPGQKIEGYIVLNVTETVRLSVLKVKFTGLISTYLAKNNEG